MEWLPFFEYRYAELPDIEVYLIRGGCKVYGHLEAWITVNKEDK